MATEQTVETLATQLRQLAEDSWLRMSRWLALVGGFDERAGHARWGFRSLSEWLAWQCDLELRTAREHVRVARRLRELALVRAAFDAGELSYSKVRAITRAGAQEDESQLLELARSSTAAQLDRRIRALRSAPSADVDVAQEVYERRSLDWSWDTDGSLRVTGRLPADEGASLVEAIETAAERIHATPDEGEASRAALPARRADALTEIALSGCPRTNVVLHVDPAALACRARDGEERAGEVCALEDGPAIPSEMARRLTCDAELLSAGGRDLGRSKRVVSPALRTSLERRDTGCQFPACTRRHGLHAHHLVHWIHGGATDKDNLILLCHFHHRLLHEGGFSLDATTRTFHGPDGRAVLEQPTPIRAKSPPPTPRVAMAA